MSVDPTARFGDRVGFYVAGRPGYPQAVVELAQARLGLPVSGGVVADLGSGTGLLSRPFLRAGCRVFGVEPNAAMAAAAVEALRDDPAAARFSDVRARAEDLPMGDDSVDLVVVGQALHWFAPGPAAAACRRVLRPGGRVLVAWNLRVVEASPFARAYEDLLVEWGTDYLSVSADKAAADRIAPFFGGPPEGEAALPNEQVLDRQGLRARVLSCSYVPGPDHPHRAGLEQAVEDLFDAYGAGGTVTLDYSCRLVWGWPTGPQPP